VKSGEAVESTLVAGVHSAALRFKPKLRE